MNTMKVKNAFVATLILCGLSLPTTAAGASLAPGAAVSPAVTSPSEPARTGSRAANALDTLADKVTQLVREKHPKAVLWMAAGESPSGPTQDMAKMTKWIFVYNTMEEEGDVASVRVEADIDGTVREVEERRHPFWGVDAIGTTRVGMTQAEAFEKLKQTEPNAAYQYSALVRPASDEGDAHREWRFNNGEHGACGYGVDVEDGSVSWYC
ncbi:hypothetical protein ABZY93_04325 [Streptomyces smyrnaeus]|uniref:hypothetical protein n=1 Tax=Streptomyces smyrnaeus TaxID=1387713 RepID=UPI0033B42FD5